MSQGWSNGSRCCLRHLFVGAGNAFGRAMSVGCWRQRVIGERARQSGRVGDVLAVVGGSGCVAVLVEVVADEVSSDRLAGPVRDDFRIVWRALAEAAVSPVRVVVLDVFGRRSCSSYWRFT